MWPIVELFTNLDLAQLSAIVPDPMLETYESRPWINSADFRTRSWCIYYFSVV